MANRTIENRMLIFNRTYHPIKIGLVVFCFLLCHLTITNNVVAQETLIVRSGDHPTYSRLVFDWNKNVTYSAELVGQDLRVLFDANAIPDFSTVIRDNPTYLSDPAYDISSGELRVTFKTNGAGRIRHFRSGTKIVVDLISDAEIPLNPARTVPKEQEAMPTAVETVSSVAVAETPTQASLIKEISDESNGLKAELHVNVSVANDAFTMDYVWNEDVKAAAFIRSNKLWVVFDKYAPANHNNIEAYLGDRVTDVRQLTDVNPTILTYSIAPDQSARMIKTTQGWQVSLRSSFAVPQLPIQIGLQSVSSVGENIFLSAEDLGNVVNILDPYVGDEIVIVTASQSSQGVSEENNYTEFNILKSAQGIALQLIADDIFVTKQDNGVSISGNNGLSVSKNKMPILSVRDFSDEEGAETSAPQMLIDFESWKKGPLPNEGYVNNRHELLYALSNSTESDRNEARWNLALYDLAYGNAAEAQGILQLMGESEPAFINNPSYRAALAVSNIRLRRFDKAIELLTHDTLTAELDARLWRSLAYEAKGEYQKALDDFNLGVDVLSMQTDENKAKFLFSSIRSAYALNDVEYMNSQIASMENIRLNAKQLAELDYWRAKLAEGYGDEVLAAEEYDKVIAAGERYTSSLAKFSRINQQYRLKQLDAMDAIDALEKLRFAWRGDDFELDLLKQLGELYVEEQEYREGLSIFRQAATYFPGSNKTDGLTKKMSAIYNDLFLNGLADNMSPLKAMALFLEFRELTPLGADGDLMLRNLANRMVSVDLLDDAANLLEYQVENRLTGVAQANIASNLAMIYVMNKEPEKALKILRSTRQPQTPDDIEFNRKMVEIRTLVELGQYEEAEVMLEGVNGDVAEDLRADIYWKTENWPMVVTHGNKTLGDRWQDSKELTESERRIVLRIAVALALEDNTNGLENFRSQYISHMENGLFADAFEIITAKEQKTGDDIRALTQTIASVDRLENFMDSYRSEFAVSTDLN